MTTLLRVFIFESDIDLGRRTASFMGHKDNSVPRYSQLAPGRWIASILFGHFIDSVCLRINIYKACHRRWRITHLFLDMVPVESTTSITVPNWRIACSGRQSPLGQKSGTAAVTTEADWVSSLGHAEVLQFLFYGTWEDQRCSFLSDRTKPIHRYRTLFNSWAAV